MTRDDDRLILESTEGAQLLHARQIGDEFLLGFDTVADLPKPAVTIFGSARVPRGTAPTARRAVSATASPRPASRS